MFDSSMYTNSSWNPSSNSSSSSRSILEKDQNLKKKCRDEEGAKLIENVALITKYGGLLLGESSGPPLPLRVVAEPMVSEPPLTRIDNAFNRSTRGRLNGSTRATSPAPTIEFQARAPATW